MIFREKWSFYSDGSEVSSADFDFDVTVRSGLTAHSEMSKAHFDFGLTVRWADYTYCEMSR